MGVRFLETCDTNRIGLEGMRCRLPLKEVVCWVDSVNIAGEYMEVVGREFHIYWVAPVLVGFVWV